MQSCFAKKYTVTLFIVACWWSSTMLASVTQAPTVSANDNLLGNLLRGSGDLTALVERIFDPEFMNKYYQNKSVRNLIYAGALIGAVYAASKIQKMNPEFFSTLWRTAKSPLVLVRKKVEILVCGGESLEWNVIVSWHNRMLKVLTPLTKQASVMELAKERRIQDLAYQDVTYAAVDVPWQQIQNHVQEELHFMNTVLERHASYYQDSQHDKLRSGCMHKVGTVVHSAGKTCVRLSSKRYEEIAFYIKKIMRYSDDCCTYVASVKTKESLDKELVKRYMEDMCSTFEHLATLVDDITAAAPHSAQGQLMLIRTQGGMHNAPGGSSYMSYTAASEVGGHY